MKLVSVIVPVYNVENYVERCLNSLVQQTYPNLEIIVVNDGSSDNSLSICERYARDYANVSVYSQINGGLSAARNTGLKYAHGAYVMFVDSDDYVSLSCIEMMVKHMEECDICEPCNMSIDENNVISDYNYHSIGNIQDYDLSKDNAALMRAALFVRGNMYRMDFLNGLFFPEGLVHEDIYYSTILFNRVKRIYVEPEAIYYYFIRSDSIMNKANNKMFDMFKIMKRLYAYYEEHDLKNYELLEKVYVRNFLISVMFKRARNIDPKYYDERSQVCDEALKFLDTYLSNYKNNPYISFKEKLAITLLRFKVMRMFIWR